MAKQKIKDIVAQELETFLAENGYELYNVEFIKEGRDWFLRVYVDMARDREESFISTEDCEKISRFLSDRLDETDPIQQNYYLEVSSPGMDRELLTEAHYERFAGSAVEVKLYRPVDGRKQIEGTLEGLTDGNVIIIDDKGQRWELPLEQVAKTNLAVVF
ncbi:ribosome maturation factor RimP [Anaerovorax odorimutans]|uniref:Ribosome maturation factor RimP n=1 Tax=Anaerovorax odorimutans TaxID=109327 RepID=A0ABT1RMZ0_9FIRM|nr:ribosome maturation factor RimP [Anaerovorax odorimutans]MCQ4636540.1 ribosome maturation factor RimP [Anaerovorax odorimutans]